MNFIIYEDNKEFASSYKNIIFKMMVNSNIDYNTIIINEYDKEKLEGINGKKIYILDIEVPGKNGIDLAREIRNNGDWNSPVIVVTSHEEFKIVGYTAKILMLDFIFKKDDLEKSLKDALEIALKINDCSKYLNISNKSEIIRIPYDDILYIEKNLNDNNSIVVTNNNEYLIRKSIVQLEEELDNDFYKSHRSCLVNVNNIIKVDFDNNIIHFKNKEINLISRSNRKGLKTRMENKYEN